MGRRWQRTGQFCIIALVLSISRRLIQVYRAISKGGGGILREPLSFALFQ